MLLERHRKFLGQLVRRQTGAILPYVLYCWVVESLRLTKCHRMKWRNKCLVVLPVATITRVPRSTMSTALVVTMWPSIGRHIARFWK